MNTLPVLAVACLHGERDQYRTRTSPSPGVAVTVDFEAEFGRLFSARHQALRVYLNRLTGDPDEAADLAQAAFVRLHERGAMPAEPTAWLVSVAHNLLRDQRRRVLRQLRLLTAWRGSVPGPAPASQAGDALEAKERRSAVRAALQRLPERDGKILLLKHGGFSYAEIARALDMPAGNVGTCLIRATAAFRRAIKEAPDASD